VTKAAEQQQEARRKKTRLAHLMLPQLDPHSALLPPDKWIFETARDIVKGNKSFQRTLGGAAAWSAGGLLAVAGGITAAVLLAPVALPAALLAGAAAAAAGFFGWKNARRHLATFKAETLPELRGEIGRKYLDYKMSELKSAWAKNLEARRRQKSAAPAPEKQPAIPVPAAPQSPPKAPKKDVNSALSDWAAKIAAKRPPKDPVPPPSPPKPPQPPQP
jgi:hypothetical protein